MNNYKEIKFFGKLVRVKCDGQCSKACGKHGSDRSYEGRDTKPTSPDFFPNRWCVRECERCEMLEKSHFNR